MLKYLTLPRSLVMKGYTVQVGNTLETRPYKEIRDLSGSLVVVENPVDELEQSVAASLPGDQLRQLKDKLYVAINEVLRDFQVQTDGLMPSGIQVNIMDITTTDSNHKYYMLRDVEVEFKV
jgi:hypothetical protein